MVSSIRQISDLPTVENTDLEDLYESTSPKDYRSDDHSVLYYGSDQWLLWFKCDHHMNGAIQFPLSILNSTNLNEYMNKDDQKLPISLYVVSGSLIIKFNMVNGINLSIPYENIESLNYNTEYIRMSVMDGAKAAQLILIPSLQHSSANPLFNPFEKLDNGQSIVWASNAICRCINNVSDTQLDALNIESGASVDQEILLKEGGQGDDELNDSILQITGLTDPSSADVELETGRTRVKRSLNWDSLNERKKSRN